MYTDIDDLMHSHAVQNIINFRPQLDGASGEEPSIKMLLDIYYNALYSTEKSNELSDEYISGLKEFYSLLVKHSKSIDALSNR